MSKDRAGFLCYLFIIATVAAAAWLYPTLPDPMPSHWNIDGEVDGYIGKPWGVALLITMIVLLALVPAIYSWFLYRRIDGFGEEGDR